jgi:Leucine-rich repeat (LRR) protein
MSDLLLKIR